MRRSSLGLGFFSPIFNAFFPHLAFDWPATNDTLYRIVAADTRAPIHIFLGLKLLTLALLPLFIFGKNVMDQKWFVVFAFALSSFVGVNSYLITGTYIVNDHYGIIEDFLVFITLVLLVTRVATLGLRTRLMGLIILFISALSIFIILDYLNFQPGYYGKWFPMHASYLAIGLLLLIPNIFDKLSTLMRYKKFIYACVVTIPFCYGVVLSYKDFQPHLPRHIEAQQYREAIEFLKNEPAGVIMTTPFASEVVHISTPHKVYWSAAAFSETVSNEELFKRWRDLYLVFPQDKSLSGETAVNSLVGTLNRCSDYGRGRWIKMASNLGMTSAEDSFCGLVDERKLEFLELKEDAENYRAQTEEVRLWQPAYRVDYLILTNEDTSAPSWLLSKYFVLEKDFGEVRIYRFK